MTPAEAWKIVVLVAVVIVIQQKQSSSSSNKNSNNNNAHKNKCNKNPAKYFRLIYVYIEETKGETVVVVVTGFSYCQSIVNRIERETLAQKPIYAVLLCTNMQILESEQKQASPLLLFSYCSLLFLRKIKILSSPRIVIYK